MALQSGPVNLWLLKALVSVGLLPIWSDWARRYVGAFFLRCGGIWAVGVFAVSRFVPLLLAVFVVGLKIPGDSVEWIKLITAHQVGPYSIGFYYILAAISSAHLSPLALVLTMIAVEVAAFALFWSTVASRIREPLVLGLLAFWLVNPISLFHISLGGQDEALILFGWCAGLWAVLHGKPRIAGLFTVVSVFFSKILGVVTCLPLVALPRDKVRSGFVAFAGVMAACIGVMLLMNISLLGFLDELPFLTSGNVWALVELLWPGRSETTVVRQFVIAGVTTVAAVGLVGRYPLSDELHQSLRITGTAGCVFLFLSPKSPTAWLVMFLPGLLFLILTMGQRSRRFILLAFFPVVAFEPSLWFYFDQGGTLDQAAWGLPVMILVDAVVLVGYGRLIWQGLRLRDSIGLERLTRPILNDPLRDHERRMA